MYAWHHVHWHYSLSLSNLSFLYGWVMAQGQICVIFVYK